MGILDTIIDTQSKAAIRDLELGAIVEKIIHPLREREQAILTRRFGLLGKPAQTLKAVGEEHGLTRERVRQIEKELLKNLRRGSQELDAFVTARDLLVTVVTEHGGLMSEKALLKHIGISNEQEANAIKFLLHLVSDLEQFEAGGRLKFSWVRLGFDKEQMSQFLDTMHKILDTHGKPLSAAKFMEKFQKTEFYEKFGSKLSEKAIVNFMGAALHVQENAFGEFGYEDWAEIHPKDVGDKAYLVMRHHGKPEHYSEITNLINKAGLDRRTAYKETVHNKLIKDKRFVLVGRGTYALAAWGFKPGVVSDIIKDVIKEHGSPMTREEIIDSVSKHRMVKKNTVLVGLSNKKHFKKVGRNLYDLA